MSRRHTLQPLSYFPEIPGYARYRVRESHVRDHLMPLISRGNVGAAKLDLLLRGLARRPQDLGHRSPRETGIPIGHLQNAELHDLLRPPGTLDQGHPGRRTTARAKSEWTRRAFASLAARKLVLREPSGQIQVLRDDGSGRRLDDPDGTLGNRYLTINGVLFPSKVIAGWGGPELAFYLCAMIGEAHDKYPPDWHERGDGRWFRSLDWFADKDRTRRGPDSIRIPAGRTTLQRGRVRLEQDGFVQVRRIGHDPDTGRAFARGGSRNQYQNWFERRGREALTASSR